MVCPVDVYLDICGDVRDIRAVIGHDAAASRPVGVCGAPARSPTATMTGDGRAEAPAGPARHARPPPERRLGKANHASMNPACWPQVVTECGRSLVNART